MQTMLEIRIYFCLWIYRLSMHGHHSSAMETDMTERLKTGELQHLLSNDRVRIPPRPDTDLETNITETTFPSGKQPAQSESKTSISYAKVCTLENCHWQYGPRASGQIKERGLVYMSHPSVRMTRSLSLQVSVWSAQVTSANSDHWVN